MTRIRTCCTSCGEVDVSPAAVTLHCCVNAEHLSTFAFTCPSCQHLIQQPASRSHADLLRGVPVAMVMWKVPLEALEPHRGAVIDYDDVLDFALADLDAALDLLRGVS